MSITRDNLIQYFCKQKYFRFFEWVLHFHVIAILRIRTFASWYEKSGNERAKMVKSGKEGDK